MPRELKPGSCLSFAGVREDARAYVTHDLPFPGVKHGDKMVRIRRLSAGDQGVPVADSRDGGGPQRSGVIPGALLIPRDRLFLKLEGYRDGIQGWKALCLMTVAP